jgi:hypothetical protein
MPTILYADDAGVIQTIALMDIESTHDFVTSPTDHPVEDGSAITDHVKLELDTWSGRVVVTNTMIETEESQMAGATSVMSSVDTPVGPVSVHGLSAAVDRMQLVFDALRELRSSRRLCTIVTARRRYESMILTRFSFPETNQDGVEITIEAREIRVVSTRTIAAPRPRQVRGNPRAAAGTVTTQPVPATGPQPPTTIPARTTNQSTLLQLFGG